MSETAPTCFGRANLPNRNTYARIITIAVTTTIRTAFSAVMTTTAKSAPWPRPGGALLKRFDSYKFCISCALCRWSRHPWAGKRVAVLALRKRPRRRRPLQPTRSTTGRILPPEPWGARGRAGAGVTCQILSRLASFEAIDVLLVEPVDVFLRPTVPLLLHLGDDAPLGSEPPKPPVLR